MVLKLELKGAPGQGAVVMELTLKPSHQFAVLAWQLAQQRMVDGPAGQGGCVALAEVALLRGPYLQSGTAERVVVRWRTDVGTDSRVAFGLAPGVAPFPAAACAIRAWRAPCWYCSSAWPAILRSQTL